jgi:hypothetical protein
MAIRGVRAGWHKLARTGAVDTGVIAAIDAPPPAQQRELVSAHGSAS